jgi:hypothetical protein
MGLLIATVTGLVIWIVGWALGAKAFDSFMITLAIVIVAATARAVVPYLPGNRAD